MAGFHVMTTNGTKNGNPAYAVQVTQEFEDGSEDVVLDINFPTAAERERLKDQLVDLVGRLTP